MSDVSSTNNDEIDLLNLLETIWYGKWKILSTIAISLLLFLVFNLVTPNTTFIASTKIKPITSFEFDKYSLFNSSLKIIKREKEDEEQDENEKVKESKVFNIFEITPLSLLSLYIEQIEEGSLLETGIEKFNLINKDDFNNEDDYKEAIEKFASDIEVLTPIRSKNEVRLHHVMRAEYNNKDKWKDLLVFVNNEANRKVKATIINRFSTVISVQNLRKNFLIKDLDIKIDNIIKDYDRTTNERLVFLYEQAAIARKLNIEKNTVSSQRFNTQTTVFNNVKTESPFYLRGFVAIEEEANLIKNRKDKTAFIKGLYKLEQEKRALKQDETLQRAIELFNQTPLNNNDFEATLVKVATTDFKIKDNKYLYFTLAIVFGGIIGVVYVLVASAFLNRKINTVNL